MAKSFSGSQRSSVAKPFSSRNWIAADRVSLGARKQGRGPGGIRGGVAFRPGQGRCFEALVRPTRALVLRFIISVGGGCHAFADDLQRQKQGKTTAKACQCCKAGMLSR